MCLVCLSLVHWTEPGVRDHDGSIKDAFQPETTHGVRCDAGHYTGVVMVFF